MDISISDLEQRFDELVRLARQGERIVVTKDGRSVAQLTPLGVAQPEGPPSAEEIARRHRIIAEIQESVRKQFEGREMPTSDHSDLYDEFGLPR